MKKRISALAVGLFCVCLLQGRLLSVPAAAAETAAAVMEELKETGACVYLNARYGFLLAWPTGDYSISESDNGDGVTVMPLDSSLELRAYGSMGWSTLGMDFKAGVEDTCTWFDKVTLKRVDSRKGTFVLSGYAGSDILYVKGFSDGETERVLYIRYPRDQKEQWDSLVAFAAKHFVVLQ
ncbi:MAG: hypothetical protein ACI4NN_06645 [Pyramidobacter sp.]|jgi:hypothetical protein